jgi:hypothetical protein
MKKIENDNQIGALNRIDSDRDLTWGVSLVAFKKIHSKYTLSAELGYQSIKGIVNEMLHLTNIENGQTSISQVKTIRNAHYITLPISIDLQIDKKVFIGGGLSANYLFTNNRITEYYYNGKPYGSDSGGNDLKKFDIGIHAQASICLSKHFSLTGKANFGILNVRPSTLQSSYNPSIGLPQHPNFETKNRQFTLGLTYFFN